MGVWGPGNLDSDGALDNFQKLVSPMVQQLAEVIESPTLAEADELSDWYMATVEILSVLSQHYFIPGLTIQLASTCRDTMLTAWQDTIDDLDPKPDYKAGRLLVMQQAFEKLLAGIRRWQPTSGTLNT